MTPIERAWRTDRVRVVAAIAARTHDLDLAEDVVQDAFFEAAARWPHEGVPRKPAAWLFATAWRRAIDALRRSARTERVLAALASADRAANGGDGDGDEPEDTDLLALLLCCAHPALDADARVALTLRHVAGLRPREIAAAFLTGETAMTKRLARARVKVRDSGVRFTVPEAAALEERMHDVRTVVVLVFNEGYLAHEAGPPLRDELRQHAIWLARALVRLRPADRESRAMLALLLFHDARSAARCEDGRLIPFEQQDRTRWDHSAIAEARTQLARAATRAPGPFAVMAAIAALHVAAPHTRATWGRIADLYALLRRLAPSEVVDLNHAYAVGRASAPHDGLALMQPLLAGTRLAGYAPLFAAAADLLERAGDPRAGTLRRRAAELAPEGSQRDALRATNSDQR